MAGDSTDDESGNALGSLVTAALERVGRRIAGPMLEGELERLAQKNGQVLELGGDDWQQEIDPELWCNNPRRRQAMRRADVLAVELTTIAARLNSPSFSDDETEWMCDVVERLNAAWNGKEEGTRGWQLLVILVETAAAHIDGGADPEEQVRQALREFNRRYPEYGASLDEEDMGMAIVSSIPKRTRIDGVPPKWDALVGLGRKAGLPRMTTESLKVQAVGWRKSAGR